MMAEFRKDISSNYMVLCPQKQEEDTFILKMLTKNKLSGLLKIEIKMIDNQKYYYYDITSKQPLSEIIKTCPVSFGQLQNIYQIIFKLPDVLKEYLISEDGIFMEPDFIYADPEMNIVEFCYYPEKKRSMQEQVAKLTEYLMNRIDYNDEQAVLTIYAIYQLSHDKNCTLKKLREVFERQYDKKWEKDYSENKNFAKVDMQNTIKEKLEKKQQEKLEEEDSLVQSKKIMDSIDNRIKKLDIEKIKDNIKSEEMEILKKEESKKNSKKILKGKEEKEYKTRTYPYMEERIENQKEVMKYPPKIYMQAIVVLIAGLFLLFAALRAGLLNKDEILDWRRCALAVFCYIAAELISFFVIFRKENQCAEIQEEIDYFSWEDEYNISIPEIRGLTLSEPIEENYYQDAFLKETRNSSHYENSIPLGYKEDSLVGDKRNLAAECKENSQKEQEEDAVTELLVDFRDNSIAYLESEFSGERIYLKKFPFLIGKLRKGTDYVLESSKISRIHAKFDYDDSHYYIEDMNSTNGTSLNGESLYAHSQKILSEGDRICFADKNFIFHY